MSTPPSVLGCEVALGRTCRPPGVQGFGGGECRSWRGGQGLLEACGRGYERTSAGVETFSPVGGAVVRGAPLGARGVCERGRRPPVGGGLGGEPLPVVLEMGAIGLCRTRICALGGQLRVGCCKERGTRCEPSVTGVPESPSALKNEELV